MGGRRRRDRQVVGRAEQAGHVLLRAATEANVHHRSDEKPHHMMQKPVRLDLEHQSSWLLAPHGVKHVTSMVVAGRSRASNGERSEAVLAANGVRRRSECGTLHWSSDAPLRA